MSPDKRVEGSWGQPGRQMRRSTLAALCMVPLLGSCGHSEDRYLKRTVERNELVGKYHGTPFAMESLKYVGYRQHLDASEHRAELRADGTCDIETVADPASPEPDGAGVWLAAGAPCLWQLNSEGPHQLVRVTVGEHTLSYYLDEERGELLLWQYVTDPDAWKYMELVRVAGDAG